LCSKRKYNKLVKILASAGNIFMACSANHEFSAVTHVEFYNLDYNVVEILNFTIKKGLANPKLGI
jgi:hypothetical protein